MRRLLLTFAALATLAGPAAAGERYYVFVFGSQSVPKRAKYTHTWATFVRTTCDDPAAEVRADTISWLAAALVVRPLSLFPEKGVNLDLHTTLTVVLGNGERVSAWGPFEIDGKVYADALEQKARLESGTVLYKPVDPDFGPRRRRIVNCLHAVGDLPAIRAFIPEYFFNGDRASYAIVRELHQGGRVLGPGPDWLFDRLGLGGSPVVRRAYTGTLFAAD